MLKLFVETILQAWWWCSLANFQCMSLHVRIAMTCQNMAKCSTNETNIESPLLQVHPSKAVNERAGRPFVHDQNFAPCPTRFRKQLMTLRKTFGKMHQKMAIAISTNLPPFTPSHRPQNLPKSSGVKQRGPCLVEGVPMIPGPNTSEPYSSNRVARFHHWIYWSTESQASLTILSIGPANAGASPPT